MELAKGPQGTKEHSKVMVLLMVCYFHPGALFALPIPKAVLRGELDSYDVTLWQLKSRESRSRWISVSPVSALLALDSQRNPAMAVAMASVSTCLNSPDVEVFFAVGLAIAHVEDTLPPAQHHVTGARQRSALHLRRHGLPELLQRRRRQRLVLGRHQRKDATEGGARGVRQGAGRTLQGRHGYHASLWPSSS